MESQRTKNALLLVIAVCLVLIVMRLYSVNLEDAANAQTGGGNGVLVGCTNFLLDSKKCVDWRPLAVDETGVLITRTAVPLTRR
jgi:hypothetical protein